MFIKVIKSLLDDNTALNTLIPITARYPYIVTEETMLPVIMFTVDSLTPMYDKDGWVLDVCEFSVGTYTDNYSSLQDIVAEVRTALELKKGVTEGITHEKVYLTGQLEGYAIDEAVYYSKFTFTVEVKKYT